MSVQLLSTILLAATLAAVTGCAKCVSVEATYDEAWEATREALLSEPQMTAADPVPRYDAGTFQAIVARPSQGDELHYHVQIKPVGGAEREKRQVCVRVREVDDVVMDGVVGDHTEHVQAVRRRDLEAIVTRRIAKVFEASDGAE